MKKQLFSFLMVLALVVLAGTSAMAQGSTLPATQVVGSPSNPKIYLNGATGKIKLTRGVANSEVVWNLYKGTSAADDAATATATPATATGNEDLDISVNATWLPTQTNAAAADAEFNFKWTDFAAGNYYLEATETDPVRNCAVTKRGFHIFIFGFDVKVYASTSAGVELTDDDLSDCPDNEYDPFLNDLMTIDGTDVRGDLFNTSSTPIPTNGQLDNAYGNKKTRRWYTAEVTFDVPTTGTFTAPADVASAKMDIQIGGTNITAKEVMSINNSADLPETEDKVATTVVERTGTSGYKFSFPIDLADRWGTDLEPVATVTNFILYPSAAAGGVAIGEEPGSKEDTTPNTSDAIGDNTSNAYTIFGRPTTSIITAE